MIYKFPQKSYRRGEGAEGEAWLVDCSQALIGRSVLSV